MMFNKYYDKSKHNILTDFALPLLFDYNQSSTIINDSYVDCYSYDINYPWMEDKIQLVYDIDKPLSTECVKQLTSNPYFHSSYIYYDNGNKEKFCFVIPPLRKRDYGMILDGMYSNISEDSKSRIISFAMNNHKYDWGIIRAILDRSHYNPEQTTYEPNEKGELLDYPECVIGEYVPFKFDENVLKKGS